MKKLIDMKIAIVYDSYKAEAEEYAKKALKHIYGKATYVWMHEEKEFLELKNDVISFYTDIIIFGGDGLVLHIANKVAPLGIPLLRVNFGDVGFLTNVEPKEMIEELDNLLKGKYRKVERVRMQGTIVRNAVINEEKKSVSKGETVAILDALNELVIGGIRKTVYLRMIVDGDESFETAIKGDGVMFVSGAGSTGYNLSARGPVLHTDIVFAVTAMHGMFNYKAPMPNSKLVNEYSMVLANVSKIAVQVTRQWPENMPYLISDANLEIRLKEGDIVIVEKSPQSTIFLEREREEKKWKISQEGTDKCNQK